MAVKNSLVQTEEQNKNQGISQYLARPAVNKKILSTLSSEKEKQKFIANITSVVAVTPDLQDCDYGTVISGGLLANSLDLPLAPSLGFCSLVPYKDRKNNRTVATFILQYKGYIQLAIRSGYYADIDVKEVHEGEYLGRDIYSGKPKFKFIDDEAEAEQLPVIGYMAYFEYLNGFKKVIYWSKEKMLKHADRYSAAFSLNATTGKYPKVSYADYEAKNYPPEDEWKYSSFWYKDFQAMAFKTMIRQLISKWGVMSVDMQRMYENDTKQMIEEEPEHKGAESAQENVENEFFGTTDGIKGNED